MDIETAIIAAIRRIVRAIDLHSRRLYTTCGVTGPQLLVLRSIERMGSASPGEISREISLGAATVTGVIDRLERQELVERGRHARDGRRVTISLTPGGQELLDRAPPLLQEEFRRELENLADWEQASILSNLQRVAAMMDAESLDADPILEPPPSGPESGDKPDS